MNEEQSPDAAALHRALVDSLVQRDLVTTPALEAAFRAVPRHIFLPDLPPQEVYEDRAIITRVDEDGSPISSSSQPAIMAIMLQQLDLQPGHNVLEIGAGTGYNAALMAHVVGQSGQVTTVDIDAGLVESARAQLAAAGFRRVQVVCGDGMRGYAENAPYDRIILTVAGWDIPPEWLAQLKPGGRIVLPLSFRGPQLSIAFERQDGRLASQSIRPCGFMPLRGPRAEPLHKIQLGDRPEVTLVRVSAAPDQQTDAAALVAWLRAPFEEQPGGLQLTGGELLFKWPLWAVLYEPDFVFLHVSGDAPAEDLAPGLSHPWRMSTGILAGSGLALLAAEPDDDAGAGEDPFSRTFAPRVRAFGPDKTAGVRLLRRLQAWDGAGRPGSAGMSVWAVPAAESPASSAADAWLKRRWHYFGVRWDSDAS